MNINVLLGIVSFVLWSIFSTWYYVTFIKTFPNVPQEEVALAPPPADSIAEPTATVPAEPDTIIKKMDPPISIIKEFQFEKNTVNPTFPDKVQAFADSLASATSLPLSITIVGHTCDLGREQHNERLSQERAKAVRELLKNASLNAEYTLVAKGESQPGLPNTTEENREKNRRVTLIIKSKQ